MQRVVARRGLCHVRNFLHPLRPVWKQNWQSGIVQATRRLKNLSNVFDAARRYLLGQDSCGERRSIISPLTAVISVFVCRASARISPILGSPLLTITALIARRSRAAIQVALRPLTDDHHFPSRFTPLIVTFTLREFACLALRLSWSAFAHPRLRFGDAWNEK